MSSEHDRSARDSAIDDDAAIVASLRAGDDAVFDALIALHHDSLVRLALHYVPNEAVAQDVVKEAWAAFLGSLERFERRMSLKVWLYRTLLGCARGRKRAEVRSVPFSSFAPPDHERIVDEARFAHEGVWAGHWSDGPHAFGEGGERALLRGDLREVLQAAVDALPPAQRELVLLRDVEGFTGLEAAEVLGVNELEQRALLHRGRMRVRAALEAHFTRGRERR